jgi:NCS1 family nucleobase:cation symporter-1
VTDLDLIADIFAIFDDVPAPTDFTVKGAKFAFLKTMVWPSVGSGTEKALIKAIEILTRNGAEVEEIELPEKFKDLPAWHATVLSSEGRVAFLPEYTIAKDKISSQLVGHVENSDHISRKAQLDAFDSIAVARPEVDELLSKYAAVITPSVPDEAPLGIEKTGSAAFCLIWTVSLGVCSKFSRLIFLIGSTYTSCEYSWISRGKWDAYWSLSCCPSLSRQKIACS